jgi:hypothetical protein
MEIKSLRQFAGGFLIEPMAIAIRNPIDWFLSKLTLFHAPFG